MSALKDRGRKSGRYLRRILCCEIGQGTVEYVALILLVALVMAGVVAAMQGFQTDEGTALGDAVGRDHEPAVPARIEQAYARLQRRMRGEPIQAQEVVRDRPEEEMTGLFGVRADEARAEAVRHRLDRERSGKGRRHQPCRASARRRGALAAAVQR